MSTENLTETNRGTTINGMSNSADNRPEMVVDEDRPTRDPFVGTSLKPKAELTDGQRLQIKMGKWANTMAQEKIRERTDKPSGR